MYQTSLTKGQELVAQRMVKEFRRQGHEACLITSIFHDWEPAVDAEEVKKRGGYRYLFEESLGIPVVRVESQGASWPPRRISFVDFVAKLSSITEDLKLNVLVTHSTLWNGPEETLKFVEWRRNQVRGGSPVRPIVYCHMSHFQEPSDQRYDITERSYRDAWNKTSLPLIVKGADLVLVTTPYEKDWMKKIGADEQKCVLFPGGIDSEGLELPGGEEGFRAKYGIRKDPKLFSFLGTVEERKNPGAILKVATRVRARSDIHFVISGRLEGDYAEQVKREAESLGNVTLTGPVSDEDVPALIKASHANITMSKSEALGLAQLEFMYAGVPVITSGVGGQSWVVKDGVNGIVLKGPDDVEGAEAAVVRMVDHPSTREKLGARAKAIASLYTMPRLVSQLSRRIAKLSQVGGTVFVSQDPKNAERVLEAWVVRGYKVAATTTRLVVSGAGGEETMTVPYDDILRVERQVKVRWTLLAGGAAASIVLLGLRFSGIPFASSAGGAFGALLAKYFAPAAVTFIAESVPAWPVAAAAVAFALTLRRGFSIVCAHSDPVFLPREFYRALKFADELTVRSIFPPETQ